jgi:hypothetical protein
VRAFATVLPVSFGTWQPAGVGTTAVCTDVAEAWPATLDAVTTMRNVEPASEEETTYVLVVWPDTAAQEAPVLSHTSHWYV